ncbi:dehydration-responsive element-binding protein 2A [Pyrus ussuriensis x Pyrus communis]|uniref:Dehydration-responsive element-binding protein 2A n=1 Tax=Pyrus ussuriensis x Pyrus communis TaxID=2448454 RepID=A0A5N5FRZ2_9ROSA|nr:dehydration-responsive element-binding protein 2A [Pyrus ussuriensis x Pyrus communis]
MAGGRWQPLPSLSYFSSHLLTPTPPSRPFPSSSPLPCFSPTTLGADFHGSMPYTPTWAMAFQDSLRFGARFPCVGFRSVMQVAWIPPCQLSSMVVSPSSTASMLSALEDRLGLGAWRVRLGVAWLGLSVDDGVPLSRVWRRPRVGCHVPPVFELYIGFFSV